MFNKPPKVPHSIAKAIHQHQQIPIFMIEEEEEGIGEEKLRKRGQQLRSWRMSKSVSYCAMGTHTGNSKAGDHKS
jgi:hypothetical protein